MNNSKFTQEMFDFEGYDEGLSNLNDTPDNEQDKPTFNGFDDTIIEERPKYTFKDKEVAWADPKDIVCESDTISKVSHKSKKEKKKEKKMGLSKKDAKKLFHDFEKDCEKGFEKIAEEISKSNKSKQKKKSPKAPKSTVKDKKRKKAERLYSEREVQLMTDNSRLRTENEYIKKRSDDAMKGVLNGIALGALIASTDDASKKYIADSIRFLNGDTYGQAFMIEGGDENV